MSFRSAVKTLDPTVNLHDLEIPRLEMNVARDVISKSCDWDSLVNARDVYGGILANGLENS